MTTKTQHQKEYIARINAVMDYIERNLDGDLRLTTLAGVAHFSPYHFHRIFASLTGETLNQFIRRIRVEKAASNLMANVELPLTEVSDKCGYSSLSVFSRSFRDAYKISPTEFRNGGFEKVSKICKMNSKNDKLFQIKANYLSTEFLTKNKVIMDAKIEVKEMPTMNFAYVRHTGQFDQIGKAYEKLFKWAGPRDLLKFPETKTATVYHDDPSVTDIENVRQSACITIGEDVKTDGEIGKMQVEGGKYAVGRFEIGVMEFEGAWNSMCHWLADSGWQPADGYPYELYYNDHMQHPEQKFILDICIPVKAL